MGEISPDRRGYRNGYYQRDLATTNGVIEDLNVPRDRAGAFRSQAFERYCRYEPQVAEGLTQMFVSGTSTAKVGEVAKTLMGVAPSASSVNRLNQSLTEQYEQWRKRSLQHHYRVIYVDGVYFTVRHGEQCDSTVILTALGVDLEGKREILALRACAEESKDGWGCLLHDLRARGGQQVDLIVTDGHEGILAALREHFPAKRNIRNDTLKLSTPCWRIPSTSSRFTIFLPECTGIFVPRTPSKASLVMCGNEQTLLMHSRQKHPVSLSSGL